MTTLHVPDMSCGHCASTITRAVKALDPAATLQIDLPAHRVQVTTAQATTEQILAALQQVGYPAEVQPG